MASTQKEESQHLHTYIHMCVTHAGMRIELAMASSQREEAQQLARVQGIELQQKIEQVYKVSDLPHTCI